MSSFASAPVYNNWLTVRSQKPYAPCFNTKQLIGTPWGTGPTEEAVRAWVRDFHNRGGGCLPNTQLPKDRLVLLFGDTPNLDVYSAAIAETGAQVILGAQHIHSFLDGSHTGGVSAHAVLRHANLSAVLVNHSELIGETGLTNEGAGKQLATAMSAKHPTNGNSFKYICLCVGEPPNLSADMAESAQYVYEQTREIISVAKGIDDVDASRLLLAHEPRGAIAWQDEQGITQTGISPSNEHIVECSWAALHALYSELGQSALQMLIGMLYGGSVKPEGVPDYGVDRYFGPAQLLGPGNPLTGELVGSATTSKKGKKEEPAKPAAEITTFQKSLVG